MDKGIIINDLPEPDRTLFRKIAQEIRNNPRQTFEEKTDQRINIIIKNYYSLLKRLDKIEGLFTCDCDYDGDVIDCSCNYEKYNQADYDSDVS